MTSESPVRLPFIRWFFPAIWMVFLVYPVTAAWDETGAVRYWGVGLTVLFAAVFYLAMWVSGLSLGNLSRSAGSDPVSARQRGPRGAGGPRRIPIILCLVAMIVIGLIVTELIGEGGLSFLAYVSVILVIVVRRLVPGMIVACLTIIIAEVAQRVVPG
ncbi:MAG: hypothetical protein L0K67_04660 [Brevibacterium sp.]|nr:hypothetical protein [Brevibacterium sp.]